MADPPWYDNIYWSVDTATEDIDVVSITGSDVATFINCKIAKDKWDEYVERMKNG